MYTIFNISSTGVDYTCISVKNRRVVWRMKSIQDNVEPSHGRQTMLPRTLVGGFGDHLGVQSIQRGVVVGFSVMSLANGRAIFHESWRKMCWVPTHIKFKIT